MATVSRRAVVLATFLIVAIGCSQAEPPRSYELQGQVLVVRPETDEILVKHEDIKGFMPAMTMPYKVKDRALLNGRAPGDLITATLQVEPELAWLSAITKTGSAPIPEDAITKIPAAANISLLKPGDVVPDTPLLDQEGVPLALSDLRDTAVVVTFIYTRCPLPQFCPLMDRRFGEIQSLVAGTDTLRGRVRLVSISFDPAHDTPAVLRAHAAKVSANPSVWRFATAGEEVVDRMAATFGVNVMREKDGTVTHNLRTAVIDPQGRVVSIHDSNAWTAASIVNELKTAILAR